MPSQMMVEKEDEFTTQEVTGILPLDVYLVEFHGADGKKGTRITLQPRGTNAVFNIQENIGGRNVATEASNWFSKAFNDKLKRTKGIDQL